MTTERYCAICGKETERYRTERFCTSTGKPLYKMRCPDACLHGLHEISSVRHPSFLAALLGKDWPCRVCGVGQ